MDTLQLSDYAERYVVDRLSQHRRRGAGAHRRPAALRDARVARPRRAGRARHHRRRRRGRAARGERRAARRPHRIERPATSPCAWRAATRSPRTSRRSRCGKGEDGYVVRLGDVAKVELASAERRAYYRSNGEHNIGLGIVKTSTANSLDVARAVRAEAERIQPTLPAGHQDLRRLRHHHLHRCRGRARVPHADRGDRAGADRDLAVPRQRARRADPGGDGAGVPDRRVHPAVRCSAISINLLTLLALVLCIGLVVDDAIVVLENIQRRADLGEPRWSRRARGTRAGRVRGDRDHRGAGRGVPADRLHGRQHRPPVPRVVGGAGRCGRDLGVRRADADADDVVQAGAPALAKRRPIRSTAGSTRAWTAVEHALPALPRRQRRAAAGCSA